MSGYRVPDRRADEILNPQMSRDLTGKTINLITKKKSVSEVS